MYQTTHIPVVQIDASAHCQLACPSCPTADGSTRPAMGAGHLSVEAFRSLLDKNPEVEEVELSNYGELFLNPRLKEILQIAAERKIVLHADNGSNLNNVSDETLEALVLHRFRSLTVSIDGASPETYAKYRIRGNFDRVIENIKTLNRFKRQHNSVFPALTWQFIVFGHNEGEIAAAKSLASELGMSFRPKISWDDEFSPIRDSALVQIQTGLPSTRSQFHDKNGFSFQRSICYQLWNQPVLNWDGRLMGCCRNFWGDFGINAFEAGLAAAMETPKLQHAKRMLTGQADSLPDIPCTTCDLYLTMREDKEWISAAELEQAASKRHGALVGLVVDAGASHATHVDFFVSGGHQVNRLLLAQPPKSTRLEIGVGFGVLLTLPPGDFTVYALPRRLDPTFRTHYPAIKPVTMPITVSRRPVCQEFTVHLEPG